MSRTFNSVLVAHCQQHDAPSPRATEWASSRGTGRRRRSGSGSVPGLWGLLHL